MPPINPFRRIMSIPFQSNRRQLADVPEAGQQTESVNAFGESPLPDSGNRPRPETRRKAPIGKEEIREARDVLRKYKSGKQNLEDRIVDNELWWELRHWESINLNSKNKEQKKESKNKPKPTSAWLFNSIVNKHADAMDNYPEPLVLPRERSDEESAKILSSVLPVVMEYNDFEDVYSDNWWEKLKHGTSCYGIFWNSQKENGLGDIDIKDIDLLKLYWEPGIQEIQNSRNLFMVELVDTDLLEQQYPGHDGKFGGGESEEIKKYLFQDNVDNSGKSAVIDWYYKKNMPGGKRVLHYCKFCCDEVLYASENDPKYADRGFYDHGQYPVVLDVLFPEKGTPVGFGYVSIAKDPQLYIDQLSSNLLRSSMMGSRKRFFASKSTNINMDDFADWEKDIVEVEGEIDEKRLREITVSPPAPIYAEIMQMKVEEMKDTSSNRDVNSGGASSGVTAGAAIAALQEAGNKTSRDSIRTSYKCYAKICKMVIELMRQFYDEKRAFRVVGANDGQYQFLNMSNEKLVDQISGVDSLGNPMFRHPVFDLKVQAQKRNPFSIMEGNQRAQELYGLGFFNPDKAQESEAALEMMEFEGKDKVLQTVRQGRTLYNMLNEANELIQQLASALGLQGVPGMPMAGGGSPAPTGQPTGISANAPNGVPRTSYMNRLAARSGPNMNFAQQAANPIRR